MPYIKQWRREQLDVGADPINAGELNYLYTKIDEKYTQKMGLKYQVQNDIAGAHLNCYMERYRRVIGPYEDIKIEENGDVYENNIH